MNRNREDERFEDERPEEETLEREEAAEAPETAEEAAPPDKKGKKALAAAKEALAESIRECETLKKKLSETEDRHLRLAAEYDNYRRRTQSERAGAYAEGTAAALEKLLPILDNLDRAASADGEESVKAGLAMIKKASEEAFAALGLESYGEVGEEFDPNLHNAILHTEDEALGENAIAAVHQRGYRIGEKILRYAMVTVAN